MELKERYMTAPIGAQSAPIAGIARHRGYRGKNNLPQMNADKRLSRQEGQKATNKRFRDGLKRGPLGCFR
jgi:hypothetical protein